MDSANPMVYKNQAQSKNLNSHCVIHFAQLYSRLTHRLANKNDSLIISL